MGGKSKQSQRTKNNVRPSSSGRSAELLNNAVRVDPNLVTSGGKVLPVLFPTLAAPMDLGLNPDLALCLKKLNKKDPITKTKALQELSELVKKSSVEDVAAALPSWAHYYRSLTTDTDHKVREAAQVTHGAIVRCCGRLIAPQLKRLVPPWLQAQYDEYAPCAAAARASLATTFPESKLPDVISFCMTEVIAHLLENLVGNAETALSKKNLTPSEKELQYARLVTASLQGLEYLTQHLPAAHHDWLWTQLAPMLQAAHFWRLAASTSQQIKASWYGAVGRIIARFGDTFGAAYGQKTARLLLADAGGAQLWGCLLVLMHHVEDWHTWLDKKELLIKRIIDVLENGGWGDAKHLSSMLLPMLAYLPEHMLTKEFYQSFFDAIFKGLEKKSVISSKSERQLWITSLSECLRYLSVQKKDFVVEVTTTVHRTWLERILVNAYDSTTKNNLIKHSVTNMVALIKYWLKQSKETNEDKYDQLVRNFWQNVGSTTVAQIDKLSTEQNDINDLIEAHILLLQSLKTSFTHDTKKIKSIKFNDEQQTKTVESPESTQQCDASAVDRYKHNLNEMVQEICAHYFEFAYKKQVANSVFTPLLTLLNEFDNKNLLLAVARRFNADSVYGLYDQVLRSWLAGDTMRCKAVADVIFLSMKYLTENEQEAMLDSFKQFPPSVVEWAISLSLSHPHCAVPAVRRWLQGDLVDGSLVAVCRRMIADDSRSRNLLLAALRGDGRGELIVSPSAVSQIVSLVCAALTPPAPALPRLASAAAALASELSGATDCTELALALFHLQLDIPRGDPRLPAETWCEVRGAWQDAGAASDTFRARAGRAAWGKLRHPRSLDIPRAAHVGALCAYLLPRLADAQAPGDARAAAALAAQLFHSDAAFHSGAVQVFALRHDCIRGNLNCPFDDDNEHIKRVIGESSRTDVEELTKEEALSFATELLFRASFLKTLALHRDEEETAWSEELFRVEYFEEEFAKVLHDYAVLCSLYEGYAFWPHYDVISRAKHHLAVTLDDVITDMTTHTKKSLLSHLSAFAAIKGYYWSYARAMLQDKVKDSLKDAGDGEVSRGEVDGNEDTPNLDEVLTGNGFFHTLQADTKLSTDKSAVLKAKYLVMLRSFYLAHAHDAAVVDDSFVRDAAAGRDTLDPDVVINAYYRHQHTMLFESDIAAADWRQVVSNAAIVDYLAAMVEAVGWEASAQLWDFAIITLCSLTTALRNSLAHWGSPKTAMLGVALSALFASASRFAGAVRARSERQRPSAHVAALPAEWADIFAPDLHLSLAAVLHAVLASAGPVLSAPRAAFISGLLRCTRALDGHLLARAPPPAPALDALDALDALVERAARALAGGGHPAYQYLAHAALHALAEPLVLRDAASLAAWSDDGATDEDDRERVRLALAGLQPALSALQELVDMALHALKVGEETCEMVPFSDSHRVALGYLLLADAAFSVAQLARGDLTHHYLELFREAKHAEALITASLRLLPAGVAGYAHDSGSAPAPAHHAHMFLASKEFTLAEAPSSQDIGWLACRGVFQCARWAGGAARGWWGAAAPRAARALERVLRAYVSPALVREQLQAVGAATNLPDDAEVTVHASTNEVSCVLMVEERALELSVSLSAAHPLVPARVQARPAPAHGTHWLAVYLAYQNGTVLNALRMWMDAVARRVEASPQCYICYCRLHPGCGRLPRVPCHQCRNKFHAQCLRKWFASSGKSNCPLCRATF